MGKSRRKVILRPLADLDLEQHFAFLAVEADIDTAKRFLSGVRQSCKTLQQNPEMGSPRTFSHSRLSGMRMWSVRGFRRHLIFYRLTPEALEVVRILHGARDVESLLLENR
jgi:toxin ParE1/3/4